MSEKKKWWNGGPLPHKVDPKEMSEEYTKALYAEPPRAEPPYGYWDGTHIPRTEPCPDCQSSAPPEEPRAESPTCHETHYYCINHTCDWVGHIKPCERKCPRCGAQVWKEGTESEFKGKSTPSCLPMAGSRPSAPAPSAERDNCQICEGWSGGVRGNENIVDGITMCDYCSTKIGAYKKLLESSPVDLQDALREEMARYVLSFRTGFPDEMIKGSSLNAALETIAAHLREGR